MVAPETSEVSKTSEVCESREPGTPAPALLKEEEKRRGTPFDLDDTIRVQNLLDGCPTPGMQQSDAVLSVF
jgi:hypothetical protein